MKERLFSPHKLDVGAFIKEQSQLDGAVPVAALTRLASGLAQSLDLKSLAPLHWSAQGRLVAQRVGEPQWWLDLHAKGDLPWECQRCLQPVFIPIEVDHSIRFVVDENTAADLDADSDDDVLAVSRQFDLLALVEDELIMAQPLVPLHEQCPVDMTPLMHSGLVSPEGVAIEESHDDHAEGEGGESGDRPNPFAVLAKLKKDNS
ncbi:MAG: DUF177 domain-containing protein [Burkholderiales bacterium]|nr:DUF177 domain-containing protein [Burkholderiales bacterium]